jgi:hypothetical protein
MKKHWHGKEERWGDRVRVNIPVEVSANAFSSTDGCMTNLSLSGALVEAEVDVGLHALVQVSIKMPHASERAEPVTAYVSRKALEGLGVEWCQFAPGVIKNLLRPPAIPITRRDSAPGTGRAHPQVTDRAE